MATPVCAMIARIILPPGPMMSRIRSGLTVSVVMRGAYCECSVARRGERLGHLAEDVEAALARLVQRLLEDLARRGPRS